MTKLEDYRRSKREAELQAVEDQALSVSIRTLIDQKRDTVIMCSVLALMSGDADRIAQTQQALSVSLAEMTTRTVPPWDKQIESVRAALGEDDDLLDEATERLEPLRALTEQIHGLVALACPDELAEGLRLIGRDSWSE